MVAPLSGSLVADIGSFGDDMAMRLHAIRFGTGYFAVALLLLLAPQAVALAVSPQAIAEYRSKLAEYLEARAAFERAR